jgi:hydroxymethylbilane synthase
VTLRLASRGSALARWQADHVRTRLEALDPQLRVEIHIVRTTGDRITDVPLSRIGDKGLFTKEVDEVVLSGDADAAVHSLKDLPTRLADGLALAATLSRQDPRDALVPAPGRPTTLDGLPAGARIGSSSLRRRAQLLHRRPDLVIEDLRGNLDTRLSRVGRGDFDAIVLAAAGLQRLGRSAAIGEWLEPPDWLPAAGQGALAVTIRSADARAAALFGELDDPAARAETAAERAFLAALEGGCQVPIGALASVTPSGLSLHGLVSDLDGHTIFRGQISGAIEHADHLGRALADQLLERGAGDLLAAIRAAVTGSVPPVAAP